MVSLLSSSPILYQNHGVTIYTHGFFFSLGAEISLILAVVLAWRLGYSVHKALILSACAFIGGIIAARIGFFITYPSSLSSVVQIFEIWQGGLVSYWGMAVGAIIAWLCIRTEPVKNRARWWDIVVISTLMGWGIGRIGNYYAADSVGVTSSGFWEPFYGRVPIQLFEAILCLGIALAGLSILKRVKKPGNVAWMASIAYFGGRFVIDMWRDEGMVWVLHLSQWVSLVVMLVLVVGSYTWRRR